MILTIVLVAIVAILIAAFGGFALGATIVYRVMSGLPPVKMPSLRGPQSVVETAEEKVEEEMTWPKVST